MTALLTADEAARLRPGERLMIARPGDPQRNAFDPNFITFVAPQAWVALTGPCPTCARSNVDHELSDRHCPDCESSNVWCVNNHKLIICDTCGYGCPDCRDGRRIVPLYRECQRDLEAHPPDQDGRCIYDCPEHDDDDCVLVGRGSIEVVPVVASPGAGQVVLPVVAVTDGGAVLITRESNPTPETIEAGFRYLPLDPLPVPGRDWGILIDCVEVV